MPRRRIRAQYEQLSELERGRIIQMKEAVFRDESRFQLCPGDHRRRVWRRPGQCADPDFTIARHTSPQPRVMVWVAISFDGRTSSDVIRGTVTVQRYID
ncbi:transposable element Tc1 transposase [Trichonephila clavipes]|nr:transposable element Tc1 transposase [Trichonephila clavipes]